MGVKKTYKVKAMISDTSNIIGLEDGGLRWKMIVHLLHKGNNVFLLLAGGVDVAQKQDL